MLVGSQRSILPDRVFSLKSFILICIIYLLEEGMAYITDPKCFVDMRRDVQEIFKLTPHDKQVMMFSATLSKEIRPVCKRFMQDVISRGQVNSSQFPGQYLPCLVMAGC